MKTAVVAVGAVLIIIALILGGVQVLHIYNIYGSSANKWYYYGGVAVIGIIGIALAAYGLLNKETPASTQKPAQQ